MCQAGNSTASRAGRLCFGFFYTLTDLIEAKQTHWGWKNIAAAAVVVVVVVFVTNLHPQILTVCLASRCKKGYKRLCPVVKTTCMYADRYHGGWGVE